jgi:hypothetical protein
MKQIDLKNMLGLINFLQINFGLKAYMFPIIYSAIVIFEIFRVCLLANYVQHQSEQFLVDFYSSEWIDSDIKYRKLMITLMEHLKKPVKVIALNFIQVDMRLFVKFLNTIYSMYTMLQSFKD